METTSPYHIRDPPNRSYILFHLLFIKVGRTVRVPLRSTVPTPLHPQLRSRLIRHLVVLRRTQIHHPPLNLLSRSGDLLPHVYLQPFENLSVSPVSDTTFSHSPPSQSHFILPSVSGRGRKVLGRIVDGDEGSKRK